MYIKGCLVFEYTKHGPKWTKLYQTMYFDTALWDKNVFQCIGHNFMTIFQPCTSKKLLFFIPGALNTQFLSSKYNAKWIKLHHIGYKWPLNYDQFTGKIFP